MRTCFSSFCRFKFVLFRANERSWCKFTTVAVAGPKITHTSIRSVTFQKELPSHRDLTKQVCWQADIKMCSHCLFPVVVTSLKQVVITLLQGL